MKLMLQVRGICNVGRALNVSSLPLLSVPWGLSASTLRRTKGRDKEALNQTARPFKCGQCFYRVCGPLFGKTLCDDLS